MTRLVATKKEGDWHQKDLDPVPVFQPVDVALPVALHNAVSGGQQPGLMP